MKMYSFRILTFLSLILLAFACKEDSLITEQIVMTGTGSISGNVFIDLNGDGVLDSIGSRAVVNYNDYLLDSITVRTAKIDVNGHYKFDSLPAANDKILYLNYGVSIDVKGTDNTPDGDPQETENTAVIHVTLDEGEMDDGNDFIIKRYQTAITGRVLSDLDGDDIGDVPKEGSTIDLFVRESDGQPGNAKWATTVTDAAGNFEIYHTVPGEYVLQIRENPNFMLISGTDSSPDPDGQGNPTMPHLIPVDLEDGEKDADNIFTLRKVERSTIGGQVLEDIDDDLVGDLPVEGHRIELYFRNAAGVPTSSTGGPVQAMNSDADGKFLFQDMEPGEYVLYHIGSGSCICHCVKGSDLTPEAGEPTVHPACFFIQVDILDDKAQDFDNTYVIKKD